MSSEFAERAHREALRYGADPWIFVRELIQNARDADAARVTIATEERDGIARVTVADDGSGMSFGHARRYLFSLYSSSKGAGSGAAGRFGVGFWSVLRFAPSRIAIRSRPASGPAWEIELDGSLERVSRRTPAAGAGVGTTIVLERPAGDGSLARRVRDAARQSARYVSRRGGGPLEVRVDGAPVNERFDLPAPSSRFRKGRVRGVVALGPEARVELFAQGLRIRAASALEDLLSAEASSTHSRLRFPSVGDGMAPTAILDGADFEPLLSRGDVRDTRSLRAVVALARRELGRLVERQIDAARPGPRHGRAWAALAIASLVASAGLVGAGVQRAWTARPQPVVPAVVPASTTAIAYRDFGHGYEGPRVDPLPPAALPLALRYRPGDLTLHFAALLLEDPSAPVRPPADAGPYLGPTCAAGCVSVDLAVDDGPGLLRVPVPTGYRIDPASVALDGVGLELRRSNAGEGLVRLDAAARGRLAYRVGRASASGGVGTGSVAGLPTPLAAVARALAPEAAAVRIAAAEQWVAAHVVYSTAPAVVARFRADAHSDVIARALSVGAGDCDVQNAVLTRLLQAAGVPARLAIGYVGTEGRAPFPAHAWVEAQVDGAWRVADASAVGAPALAPSPQPRVPDPIRDSRPRPEVVVPPSHVGAAPRTWLSVIAVAVVAAAALALVAIARRTRRELRVAGGRSVAALLRGALRRPHAYRDLPAVTERRLVPTLDGRGVSLSDAVRRAAERRLFRSGAATPFARAASDGGALVLDGRREEGRIVADALGVVDLDEWDAFLAGACRLSLLAAVERRLAAWGEPCDLMVLPALAAPAVLDLPQRRRTRRVVVLARDDFAAADATAGTRPAAAVFQAAAVVAHALQLDVKERRAFLGPLARAALREAAS